MSIAARESIARRRSAASCTASLCAAAMLTATAMWSATSSKTQCPRRRTHSARRRTRRERGSWRPVRAAAPRRSSGCPCPVPPTCSPANATQGPCRQCASTSPCVRRPCKVRSRARTSTRPLPEPLPEGAAVSALSPRSSVMDVASAPGTSFHARPLISPATSFSGRSRARPGKCVHDLGDHERFPRSPGASGRRRHAGSRPGIHQDLFSGTGLRTHRYSAEMRSRRHPRRRPRSLRTRRRP